MNRLDVYKSGKRDSQSTHAVVPNNTQTICSVNLLPHWTRIATVSDPFDGTITCNVCLRFLKSRIRRHEQIG